jgi:hypothetical protein
MVKRQVRRALPWRRIAGYSSESETAKALCVTIRTLRKWRQRGMGPPWVKIGRRVVYSNESRAAWLKGNEVRPVRMEARGATRLNHTSTEAGAV